MKPPAVGRNTFYERAEGCPCLKIRAEAVRIRLMKKLLIRSCLMTVMASMFSCSFTQREEPRDDEPVMSADSVKEVTPMTEKKDYLPPLPAHLRDPFQNATEKTQDAPIVLPGDNRPGLRAPKLPNTLLYDMDGKLIKPTVQ